MGISPSDDFEQRRGDEQNDQNDRDGDHVRHPWLEMLSEAGGRAGVAEAMRGAGTRVGRCNGCESKGDD
jgi:hypothetical protein